MPDNILSVLTFQDIIPGVYRALAKISVDLAYVLGELI